MSFKLRVLFEGICVLFPDSTSQSTEIIFPYTGTEDAEAHTCQFSVRRGNVVRSQGQLPVTLRKTDVYFSDGPNLIGESLEGSHSFSSIPKLHHVWKDFETHKGVRRADLPTVSKLVNGRLVLMDGLFSELHLTNEKYEMYDKDSGQRVGPKAAKVFQCLMYERVITSPSVTIRDSVDKNSTWSFACEPVGGFVEVVIGNHSHDETRFGTSAMTDAPHFAHVFDLFKKRPERKIGLRAKCSAKKRLRAMGLRVPCVGGCAC
jgi:hypothetical protein